MLGRESQSRLFSPSRRPSPRRRLGGTQTATATCGHIESARGLGVDLRPPHAACRSDPCERYSSSIRRVGYGATCCAEPCPLQSGLALQSGPYGLIFLEFDRGSVRADGREHRAPSLPWL